ncbi:MAG: hypothetical protein JAY71_18835 [Candidatus Thiodiazotropha weberae]|nr:hypothetical protein [Candidatus Thiodiazotropha weberae]
MNDNSVVADLVNAADQFDQLAETLNRILASEPPEQAKALELILNGFMHLSWELRQLSESADDKDPLFPDTLSPAPGWQSE